MGGMTLDLLILLTLTGLWVRICKNVYQRNQNMAGLDGGKSLFLRTSPHP